jgi:putative tricarboxylic transport membrane protein
VTDAADRADPHTRDILAEIESEVAQELDEERPPAGGPAYQIAAGVVGLVIGIGGAVLSYGYGLGTLRQPGGGTWPFIASIVVAALSAVFLITGRKLDDTEAFTRASLLPAAGTVSLVAFGALLPVTGFEIPAVALCVVWLRFLGRESWRNTVVISVVTTAVFYVLFLYGLRIPLPHLIAI